MMEAVYSLLDWLNLSIELAFSSRLTMQIHYFLRQAQNLVN